MEEGYSMCYYLAMVCATVWASCKGVKEDYDGYTLRLEDYPRVIGDGSKRFDSNKIRMRQLTLYVPEKEAGVVELLLHRLLPLRGLLKLPLLLLHLGLEVGSSLIGGTLRRYLSRSPRRCLSKNFLDFRGRRCRSPHKQQRHVQRKKGARRQPLACPSVLEGSPCLHPER
ncbi:hypothetical protein GW17_00051517 [Ensete ventricosum]|nr:hypothetical protein GW17_00051517 [Ensete ventricosum]